MLKVRRLYDEGIGKIAAVQLNSWGHGAALQGIVEDVVSDLQRHHADTG
jgi:hypothetical protein